MFIYILYRRNRAVANVAALSSEREENSLSHRMDRLEHVFAFPEGSRLATESLGRGRVRMTEHHTCSHAHFANADISAVEITF